MTSQSMSFGEYITMLRLERHLSLAKASRRMAFTPQKLCDIEKGRRYQKHIPVQLVQIIAKAYNVPIAEIIRNTETAVAHDKTVSELLDELWPKAKYAEMLGDSLLTESRKYAPELENKLVEIANSAKEIRALLSLLRKRHFTSSEPIIP